MAMRQRLDGGTVAMIIGALLATAALPAREARAQITAQTLIGKAVSDDAQNQEVTGAINRFRDRDIDGCRAILERAKSNNAKLPPPGVMMAMLWLSVNQLGPARAELEDCVIKFSQDPEPYLMMGDLAFQDRRVTDADMLFKEATRLAAEYDAWFAEVMAEWRAARSRILAHDQAAWRNRTPPDPRQLFRDEWPWSNAPGADPRTADPREVFRGFWSDHP